MNKRLAILCTHPIQYYVPVFQKLSQVADLDVKVFYGWEGGSNEVDDPGFGRKFQWDIPLLEGYEYEFLPNVATSPGSSHFFGIDLPTLNQRLDLWNPDLLLVYGWCFKAHLKAMRYYHGSIPVLFRGDSTLLDETPGIKRLLRRLFLRWVYSYVDIALYVGTENKRYFKAHGLSEGQLVFAPHAIDNDRFSSSPDSNLKASEIRKNLGIKVNDLVLLFVGKLESKKCPKLLLEAFLSIKDSHLHLIYVGSGELEELLREHSNERVHFLGFQNQTAMPAMYRTADVVILPSIGPGETWGMVINEAMACSRPVIASNRTGATTDLIHAGMNGWVFDVNDPEGLVNCLNLFQNCTKKKLGKMGMKSSKIIDSWTIEKQVYAIRDACGI